MRSKFEELKRSYLMSLQLQCQVRMTWYLDISTIYSHLQGGVLQQDVLPVSRQREGGGAVLSLQSYCS